MMHLIDKKMVIKNLKKKTALSKTRAFNILNHSTHISDISTFIKSN